MKKLIASFALFLSACGPNVPTASPQVPPPVRVQAPPPVTPVPAPAPARESEPKTRVAFANPAFALETGSLYIYRTREIASLTNEQIRERNESDIAAFEAFQPGSQASKKTGASISAASANAVIQATYSNPVVSPYSMKYQRPDVQIGYCFGRAAFAHIALKKMGVQTSSIRKVWLVGPMKTSSTKWGFHVATTVFVENLGWQVLDSNLGRIVSVRDWLANYNYMSEDNRLRIYFTSPTRFGVSIPQYERVDMGLDLTPEKDWYQHYFYDLMAWFRTADFPALGLDRVKPSLKEVPPSKTAVDDIYAAKEAK